MRWLLGLQSKIIDRRTQSLFDRIVFKGVGGVAKYEALIKCVHQSFCGRERTQDYSGEKIQARQMGLAPRGVARVKTVREFKCRDRVTE